MITEIEESKILIKYILCNFKFKFDCRKCNSKRKYNNNKCQQNCKKLIKHHLKAKNITLGILTYVLLSVIKIMKLLIFALAEKVLLMIS